MGAERLARLQPSTDPQQVAQCARRDDRNGALRHRARRVPAARVERSAADPGGAGRRGTRARGAAPARARRLSRFGRRGARRASAARRDRFRCSTPRAPAPRRSRARSAQSREKIDPSGDVVDHASPELRIIRDRLRKQRDAPAQHARVVPARQGHGEVPAGSGRHRAQRPLRARRARPSIAAAIPGIVHGTSTSGASLFLEPLSTVEINNDIVALEEQEAEEVRRILLALTDAFRARAARHAAHDRGRDRARRAAGARALLRVDRRHRAGAVDRRRVRAAGGAASAAARTPVAGAPSRSIPPATIAARSPDRTPAARPSR